ncbi:Lyso-phosphatidylcholine acyltransferase [Thecaphora frezii]
MDSRFLIHSVAAFSKLLLSLGCRKVEVNGLPQFLNVLEDQQRRKFGRGVVTYCNHISVMDEPTIWATLPWRTFRSPHTTRWTLGASDIMFTSPFLRRFFAAGQVIETIRGGGIFQRSMDTSIAKLNEGQWIHLFPEGFVNVGTDTTLRRFKWGVSRLVAEAEKVPLVVPIWITGFDQIMPEPRAAPKFLPRFGADLSITFGSPIPDITLSPLLDPATVPDALVDPSLSPSEPAEARQRSAIAALLRNELINLARSIRIQQGRDPDIEDRLCHTATLTPNQDTTPSSKEEEDGKKRIKNKIKQKLGSAVDEKVAESGWKDSAT